MSTLNEDLEFSKNWENDEDFPTREYNEATVRENIQLLFDEIKDHINNKVTPAINDNMDRITSMGGGGMITHELLGDDAVEENNIKRGAITEYKYGTSSIPTSAFKNSSITAEKLHTATVNPYIDSRIDAKTDSLLSSTSTNPVQNKVVKSALDEKAPKASPALTGIPTAPTASNSTNSTQIATTAYVHNYAQPITGVASTSASGLMSASDKTKLNGIASGAEVNQNAFSNVTVGSTTIAADSKTDTLTLIAGSNVTLTPDATNDRVTIASTNTTYSAATTSTAGLMSAADKTKLNGIAAGANAYSLPTASSSTLGGVKTGSNITNSSGTISLTKANVTSALGYTPPTADTNTWRPVQNNLTSSSTSDALSANQGRVLKGLVDGKASSSHEHTSLIYGGNAGEVSVTADGAVMQVRRSADPNGTVYSQVRCGKQSSTAADSGIVVVHCERLIPSGNGSTNLGDSTHKWKNVFNEGSDRRLKKDIDYDMSAYLEAFDNFKPCHFYYKDEAFDKEYNGVIAQEAEQALKDAGVEDSSMFFTDEQDSSHTMFVNYNQFIGILIAKVQDLQKQVDELKAGDK